METMKQRISRLFKEAKINEEALEKYLNLGLITDEEKQAIIEE